MLRLWYRSERLRIGGLLLLVLAAAAVVVPVLVPADLGIAPRALFTVSGLNARTQHTQPDEPDWKKGLELTTDLRGAAVTTGYRVPFVVRGTFDDPQFSQSRTPLLIRDQSPQQPQQ